MGPIRFTEARAAVRAIPDGSRVILPQGCAEPSGFYRAFAEEVGRFRDLQLVSGLQVGSYEFLRRGLGEHFSYATWQVGPGVRALAERGQIEYVPVRYREIARHFAGADVVVLHVAPPDTDGRLSLGVSVSLGRALATTARQVIAEVSERMPSTLGASTIPREEIDLFIESDSPPAPYRSRPPGEAEAAIARRLCELIPDGAWVQLGIGAVPEKLASLLAGRSGLKIHSGMVSDGIVELIAKAAPKVIAGEVVGSEALFRFVHESSALELHPVTRTHDVRVLAALDRFVAVNSALEVDLSGQVNAEGLGATPVGGVGGSLDFLEGAALSRDGRAIVALPSTARQGRRSRIVPFLPPGTPVTIPRHCVQYVVTEHGVADLRGCSLGRRAEKLAAIAHPDFREGLIESWQKGDA